MRTLLSDIYHALLRDLYDVVMSSYDDKAQLQRLGAIMTIIDDHIKGTIPALRRANKTFSDSRTPPLTDLRAKARELYGESLEKAVTIGAGHLGVLAYSATVKTCS